MSSARHPLVFAVALFSLLGLVSCGGASMHVAPAAPVFTSTPGTAAAQDTTYSYAVTATDPAGGSVSFSLSAPLPAPL